MAKGESEKASNLLMLRRTQYPDDPINYSLEALFAYVSRHETPLGLSAFAPQWTKLMRNLRKIPLLWEREDSWVARPISGSEEVIRFRILGLEHLGQASLKQNGLFARNHIPRGGLEEYLSRMIEWSVCTPRGLQLALAYMCLAAIKWHGGIPVEWLITAVKNEDLRRGRETKVFKDTAYSDLKRRAVASLSRACDEQDPMMVWLNLWPVFDPLRDRSDFKAIVERIGLQTGP